MNENEPNSQHFEYEDIMCGCVFEDFEETQFLALTTSIKIYDLDKPNPLCVLILENDTQYEFIGRYEYSLGTRLFFDSNDENQFAGDSIIQLVFKLKKVPLTH